MDIDPSAGAGDGALGSAVYGPNHDQGFGRNPARGARTGNEAAPQGDHPRDR